MQTKIGIVISPNWRDYGKKYLAACIESIRSQDSENEMKIFITDNETSPESFAFLRKIIPEAEIIMNTSNEGYAKGVNDSIRAALSAGCEYVAIVNIHTVLDRNYIAELKKVFVSEPEIGAVQGLMLLPGRNLISSAGNSTHFLGFGYCEKYKDEVDKSDMGIKEIFYPSGSSIFTSKQILEQIGLFDEVYWMYNEDQELGWRMHLAGLKIKLAPKAILVNHYEFQRSIKKYYWMDRNRILATLQCYSLQSLLLLMPAFIVWEIGLIFFSIKGGWFFDKLRVWAYFLNLFHWPYIIKARRRNQKLRVVKDIQLISLISGRIWYQEVDDWKLRWANVFFGIYWSIMKRFI